MYDNNKCKEKDVVTRRVSVVKKWSRNFEYLFIHVLGSSLFLEIIKRVHINLFAMEWKLNFI